VYIRDGYYALDDPIVFEPEDGGERVETNLPTGAFEYHKLKDYYVTYAAYPGEKPIIGGGPLVSGWRAKSGILTTTHNGPPVEMLVADGRTLTLARTPNSGYFVPPVISETTDRLHFNPGELKSWKQMEGNRVTMLLRWHTGINSFTKIDEKNKVAYFEQSQDGVVVVPPRYFVENIPALLDSAGEWYYNGTSKALMLMPPEITSPERIVAPAIQSLVQIRGDRGRPVRNLRLYGLTLEGVLPGASAIAIRHAHACEIVDSQLQACGGTGIHVQEGCYQTRVLHNTFKTVDNMAILLRGPAEPGDGRDILRETLVSYNRLYDCGGVNIQASFSLLTTISHNYITKTRGRYAISVGGWANLEEAIDGGYLVEYNHLDDVQKGADDSGAIKTAGTTFNSTVRRNLVHDVRAGYFNDNVGFWFDNMSLGWVTEDNIFYNLEQGEMKLCAANLVDNIYRNNYVIPAPNIAPEPIIDGLPEFRYSNLQIHAPREQSTGAVQSGSTIRVSADVYNAGSTGIESVYLYHNGKVKMELPYPVVRHTTRTIDFELRLYEAGRHTLAVGATPYQAVQITGIKPDVVFENLVLSTPRTIEGESVQVSARAKNLSNIRHEVTGALMLNEQEDQSTTFTLEPMEERQVYFTTAPKSGTYEVRIGNSNASKLLVQAYRTVDPTRLNLGEYCSAKASPYKIRTQPGANTFTIQASGTDFFHAEDSYATIFLEDIKGDFVAQVRIDGFGERTHEWFRAGIFARNDLTQSFDTKPGSKGSMLVFGTPGRAGIEYDEFGNGCMHKANSENLPEDVQFPVWLKLVRHGSSFTGSISFDGNTWIREKTSVDLPGLQETIDLGLAAGAPDQKIYSVTFSDWRIKVAK
jgi:regulation of enolase protein 1 (concanavalin A-like superfamily)